jgi:conjugal transfer pilus assembly protein TraF
MRSYVFFILAIGVMVGACRAEPPFYQEKERGWHWYEDPPKKADEVVKKIDPPPVALTPPPSPAEVKLPSAKVPAMFSAAWLRENMQTLRDDAIDHPDDPAKVSAFLYAQRVLFDKAQRFASSASTIAKTDPLLDETNRIPMDTAAIAAVQQGITKDRIEALKFLAGVGGILFFFDSSCPYCATQFAALAWLSKDYGFTVKNISVDGKAITGMPPGWTKDEGQAKALGLTIMPTTIFAVPPDRYYIISQGYHSAETLGEKIVMAAMGDKLIPESLVKSQQTYERGVLTAEDLRDPKLNPAEGKSWVEALRKKLGTRY